MANKKNKTVKERQHPCPVFLTLELIGNKWSIAIIAHMLSAEERTVRFNTLRKLVAGISQSELTKRLRAFEAGGIVRRKVYPEIPPRVEYTLTSLGASLNIPIMALHDWAAAHYEDINKSKESYAKKLSNIK